MHLYPPRCLARMFDCLLPPVCAICGVVVEAESVCADCRSRLEPAPLPSRLAELEVRAALYHVGSARTLIHALKYGGRRDLAPLIAELVWRSYQRDGIPAGDCLVPIPLHRRRQLRRGYNQSRLLAVALGQRLGLPVHEVLVRRRATGSQTRLSAAARRRNLAGAFGLCRVGWGWAAGRRRVPLAGRRVVLIDDVVTTGATLGAAVAVLQAAGVAAVVAQVGARAE